MADLGGDDRLHARRQRRVVGGDRVVVVEVAALLLTREALGAQVHREHHVGLLQHLEAVDHERVVVEQQGVVVGRRVLEVPRLALEEAGVLGVDAERLVVGDEHRLGGATPRLDLAALEPGAPPEPVERGGLPVGEELHRLSPRSDRLKRAIMFVYVLSLTTVVYSSGPVTLWMWNKSVAVRRVEPEVLPEACRLDHHLGALVDEEVDVAGGVEVALQRVRHGGVDVVLGGARRVVRRRLLAVDGAPRVQRAATG